MKSFATTLALCAVLTPCGAAQAALIDRGGGLIYDSDLNITWLADANVNGRMNWGNAMAWASNFSYYDSVRNVTYSDWRLPNSDTCSGYNCTGSEMGHLFYEELGGKAKESILTSTDSDLAFFRNIQETDYWSSTPYYTEWQGPWAFGFFSGIQSTDSSEFAVHALVVRSGDVAAVPVPAAAWLLSSGFIGLIGVARRKTA